MLERSSFFIVIPILVMLSLISGCRGKSDEKRVIYNSTQDRPAIQQTPGPNPAIENGLQEDFERRVERLERKKIEEVQSRYRIDCESNAQCGDSVGMLVMVGDSAEDPGQGVGGRCTAFLISERHLMTNHHCVAIGKNLSMQVLFPETTRFPAETIRVSRVVGDTFTNMVSLVSQYYQDVAIVELDRSTSRPSMALSGKTLTAGDEVTAVVVDPVETGGLSRVKSCRVSGNGLLDSERDDHRGYRQAILRDCSIMSGNSGGMVLDGQGNVVAILYGATDPAKVFGPKSPFPMSWRAGYAKAQFSMANRIGCLSEQLLATAGVKRIDSAECESLLYATRNEYFTHTSPLQPLADRQSSYTFVDGPEGAKFQDDRLLVARLMIPGCANSVGSYDFDAPVLVRSYRMDDEGRMIDLKNQVQGARPVRITVEKFIDIEGFSFAEVQVNDGSAQPVDTILPNCNVPVLRNVTPDPFQ